MSKVKLSSTHNISVSNITGTDRFVILAKDGTTFYQNRLLSIDDAVIFVSSSMAPGIRNMVYISSSGQNVRLGDIKAGDVNANTGYFRSLFIETSSIVLTTSGSTIFGNTLDDIHQFTGSIYITGSEFIHNGYKVLTSNDTSSLSATSSYAVSSSHAEYAEFSQYAITASISTYAFHADQADIALDALHSETSLTASYVKWENIDNIPLIEPTASLAITASYAVFAQSASYAVTASDAANAFRADQADIALTALNANTASYIHYDNIDGIPTPSVEMIYTEYYHVTSSTITFDLQNTPTNFNQVRIQPEGAGEMVNSQSLSTTNGDISVMSIIPDFRVINTKTIEVSGSGLSGLLYGSNELLILTYPYII
jgi:hypothetical protein